MRRRSLSVDAFAAAAGMHPELVARMVALGLFHRRFSETDLAAAARVRRLHATLPLNYAAIGVVLDLLDRIDELESLLRRRSWTSTD